MLSHTEQISSAPTVRPSPRVISSEGLVAIRSALQAQLLQGVDDESLRRAIGALCLEARRTGLRIEQLIVTLKAAWASVPEARRRARSNGRDDMLDGIITMSIEEFYSGAVE